MNETQPRPLYDVIAYFPGEPADTGERKNEAPMGIFAAIEFAARCVVDMQDVGWRLDDITTSSMRQRWHLHFRELKAVVDVVEVKAVAS